MHIDAGQYDVPGDRDNILAIENVLHGVIPNTIQLTTNIEKVIFISSTYGTTANVPNIIDKSRRRYSKSPREREGEEKLRNCGSSRDFSKPITVKKADAAWSYGMGTVCKVDSSSSFIAKSFGFSHTEKWNYKVQFVGVERRKEHSRTMGKSKFLVYIIDVHAEDKQWTIYRRYSSFFNLDQKLKKKGLLKTSDDTLVARKSIKMKKRKYLQKRYLKLKNYLSVTILGDPKIHQSQYTFNFLGPFQIGDIKPTY
jgi:hypothetical protein